MCLIGLILLLGNTMHKAGQIGRVRQWDVDWWELEGPDNRQDDDGNYNKHREFVYPAEKDVPVGILIALEIKHQLTKIAMVSDQYHH